jgi:hypothetical protein
VDNRLKSEDHIAFNFGGRNEMELVTGTGMTMLEGDRLIFKLTYHYGDDFSFECERR